MRIVVLTGAGISAESGLGTFRDKDGLWSQYDLAEVATPEGYARNPQLVLDFYNMRRRNAAGASANAAHRALARLAKEGDVRLDIITQNIDDLHEQGGSEGVMHIHGSIFEALCGACGAVWESRGDLTVTDACPACEAGGKVRPNIVWFGEVPYRMDEAIGWLESCDIFVSVGTSGTVYPAAGFVSIAAECGARTLELNLEESEGDSPFQEVVTGPATQIVPDWVERVLADHGARS